MIVAYGPAVIDHCLQSVGFPPSTALGSGGFDVTSDLPRLVEALDIAEGLMGESEGLCKGFIIQKVHLVLGLYATVGRTMNTPIR